MLGFSELPVPKFRATQLTADLLMFSGPPSALCFLGQLIQLAGPQGTPSDVIPAVYEIPFPQDPIDIEIERQMVYIYIYVCVCMYVCIYVLSDKLSRVTHETPCFA